MPAASDIATDHSASVGLGPFSLLSEKFNDAGPSHLGICSFAAAGDCPRGESCPHIHGDLCPICERRCLHPSRPQERDEHMKICEKRRKHLEALRCSQEIECSVCLEAVLSKPTSAERKFGILSECDHSFCISCIRNWRSSSPTSGINMNSAVRACPICRRLSYFVIPSVIWYSSREEKQEIVQSYKTKLRYNLGIRFYAFPSLMKHHTVNLLLALFQDYRLQALRLWECQLSIRDELLLQGMLIILCLSVHALCCITLSLLDELQFDGGKY